MHVTRSWFVTLPMMNTRPSATVTEEKPAPTFVFHSAFGPSADHIVDHPFSSEMPSPDGLRQRYQSVACAVRETHASQPAIRTIRVRIMRMELVQAAPAVKRSTFMK